MFVVTVVSKHSQVAGAGAGTGAGAVTVSELVPKQYSLVVVVELLKWVVASLAVVRPG